MTRPEGRTMYERAVDLLDEGVLVAIVPTETPDGNMVGLYAIAQDLEHNEVVKIGALHHKVSVRAATALALTSKTRQIARRNGLKLRTIPRDCF